MANDDLYNTLMRLVRTARSSSDIPEKSLLIGASALNDLRVAFHRDRQQSEMADTAALASAWDAGFLDGYDNGSTYGAEGNSTNPYIEGDAAKAVCGRLDPRKESS